MKHIIVGTAGHVDHGKSTLIKALTGIETDRLKSEKQRGISIELGFAYMDLDGIRIGLVDVPGHEKFIKNMLAGAGGMDMVLLVVAADEGVMPQTKEHMDILRFLEVKKGIVVLTKVDLVEEDWLSLVKEDLKSFLKDSFLENAPIIEVSSTTGQGLDKLKETISLLIKEVEERPLGNKMRLPIDRVFTITGFGTVITGTLVNGTVAVGDILEVLPENLKTRVRSVQVHNNKMERAFAGQRVAINLSDLEVWQISRGSVVCSVNSFKASFRIDIKLSLLPEVKVLKNRSRIRVYLGTSETIARVILLEREDLKGGQSVYAQLVLETPLVADKKDHLVIRSYSPMNTIGGGFVINPVASRHKSSEENLILELETLEKGTSQELTYQYLSHNKDIFLEQDLIELLGINKEEIKNILENLASQNQLKIFKGKENAYLALEIYLRWVNEIIKMTEGYLKQYPLREGFPREELRSKICPNFTQKKFQMLLQSMEQESLIELGTKTIALPNYEVSADSSLGLLIEDILAVYEKSQFKPPAWSEVTLKHNISKQMEQEMLHYLLRKKKLIKISNDIYLHQNSLIQAEKKIKSFLQQKQQMTVAEAKDLLDTTRKYIVPIVEYFDKEKLTKRVEDFRVLV